MGIQDQRPSVESKSCQDQNSSTIKSYQSFTVFYTNADNLINKRNELYHSLTSVKPEIICITEILAKNALLPVDDCEFQIQGFDCFMNNNKSKCHRSVLIYTKKCLKADAANFSELDCQEYMYCKLSSKNSGLLHILCIYRSPNSTIDNNNNLNSFISNDHLLILNDFNYPTINWATLGTPHNKENCTTKFLTVTQNCFLHQHVNNVTHVRPIDWKELFHGKDVNLSWKTLLKLLNNIILKYTSRFAFNNKRKKSIWMNSQAFSKVQLKNRAYHQYLCTKDHNDYNI